jgi:hypothetical protein
MSAPDLIIAPGRIVAESASRQIKFREGIELESKWKYFSGHWTGLRNTFRNL